MGKIIPFGRKVSSIKKRTPIEVEILEQATIEKFGTHISDSFTAAEIADIKRELNELDEEDDE